MIRATAERIHADFIITRNIKDFRGSKITALTPAELFSRLAGVDAAVEMGTTD